MANSHAEFQSGFPTIVASLKKLFQRVRQKINPVLDYSEIEEELEYKVQRHEATMNYLEEKKFFSNERKRDLFDYVFYERQGKFINKVLSRDFSSPISADDNQKFLDKKKAFEEKADEFKEVSRRERKNPYTLEVKISLFPSEVGEEYLVSARKKIVLADLMKDVAKCTDNKKLSWTYRRLLEPDYDFLRKPTNCLTHFFRRHDTTQTWSTVVDMLKTRMMLNALYTLRYALEHGNLRHFNDILRNDDWAYQLLNAQRNRWLFQSEKTAARFWMDEIDSCSDPDQKLILVNEVIGCYKKEFKELWPEVPAIPKRARELIEPFEPFKPFSGKAFRLTA